MLSVEQQADILSLHFGKQYSLRKIARELGINRKSVKKVIARRSVETQAKATKRASLLTPYQSLIEQYLTTDPKLPATVLFQRLREQGYPGSYSVVKRHLASQRPLWLKDASPKQAFLSIEFAPAQCAQVDWGEFGDVFGNGTKIHCFVMVLSFSRLMYLEFTRKEKFEDFIRCHERAFRFFGGATQEIWYDNLATAVSERKGSLIKFNARFLAYLGHHGVRPHACNPARGNEKGRVEDGVKYIKSNFWPSRSFLDFLDINHQAADWLRDVANRREHRSTRKVPQLIFEAQEKNKLLPLNPIPYDTDQIFAKTVPPDYHIVFETNRYSLPFTLVGQTVSVRVNEQSIRFFYHDRQVASHERSYLKHQRFTKPKHQEGLFDTKPQAQSSQHWQINTLKSLGGPMKEYLACLQASPRSLRFELSKLLALKTVYGTQQLNQVVADLLKKGVIGVDHVEMALKNQQPQAPKPAPLSFQNEKLARYPQPVDLRRYDHLLFDAKNQDLKNPSPEETKENNKKENNEKNHENKKDPS